MMQSFGDIKGKILPAKNGKDFLNAAKMFISCKPSYGCMRLEFPFRKP